MAGLDKVFGTETQYWELRKWTDAYLPELNDYLNDPTEFRCYEEYPVSNLPTWADMYVVAHCEVEWYLGYIALRQYSLDLKIEQYQPLVAEYAEEGYQKQLEYDKEHEDLDEGEEYSDLWVAFEKWRDRGYPVSPKCIEIVSRLKIEDLV